MVQALLSDRFKLRVHREVRDGPVYQLLKARADRRLGPQLRRTALDCAAVRRSGIRPVLPPGEIVPPCSSEIFPDGEEWHIKGTGMTLQRLTELLQSDGSWSKGGGVDRKVIDRTGLDGEFDVQLEWAWEASPNANDGRTLFSALQQQLGLRLQPARGTIDVLVIDSLQLPTEN
jgi:uncharacterized protein (TIGR03435 family)